MGHSKGKEPGAMHPARETRKYNPKTLKRPHRIVVCDYSGHPFQVQLSRELARRGHEVLHLYSSDFLSPHGLLKRRHDDAPTFNVEGLSIGEPYVRNSLFKRRRQETKFGYVSAERALAEGPDVVLSCNMPLDAQVIAAATCRKHGVRFLLWLQDIYSIAISRVLTKKLGWLGNIIGWHYRRKERMVLNYSESIICICGEFRDVVATWGISGEKCIILPNWGPVDEIRVGYKNNSWAQIRSLDDKKVILYSGTLGFKHNGEILLSAAEMLKHRDEVMFVIVSEGEQAHTLQVAAKEKMLHNFIVLPFQPYEDYPDVLATADILIGCIGKEAGVYSVPSKILSYLCAGRPIVLAAPLSNLASRTVIDAGAGVVVPAEAPTAFVQALSDLLNDERRRVALGRNARTYAERHFDIGRIADAFESILRPEGGGARQTVEHWGSARRVDRPSWRSETVDGESPKRRRPTTAGVGPRVSRRGRGSSA